MARAFLVVLDSAGIGGAPDADEYFNGDTPDTGANTVGHSKLVAPGVGGCPTVYWNGRSSANARAY